jgi:hypothetical protein
VGEMRQWSEAVRDRLRSAFYNILLNVANSATNSVGQRHQATAAGLGIRAWRSRHPQQSSHFGLIAPGLINPAFLCSQASRLISTRVFRAVVIWRSASDRREPCFEARYVPIAALALQTIDKTARE